MSATSPGRSTWQSWPVFTSATFQPEARAFAANGAKKGRAGYLRFSAKERHRTTGRVLTPGPYPHHHSPCARPRLPTILESSLRTLNHYENNNFSFYSYATRNRIPGRHRAGPL